MHGYLVLDHLLADVEGDESVGVLLLDESVEAGDEQRVVGQFLLGAFVREIVTLLFHFRRMCTLPCSILQGMAPEEYRCAKELPFFSEKGSTVLMLVSLAVGNSVKPVLGLISSFSMTLICLLVPPFCRDMGLVILLAVFEAGCI
jgi:hypothetical protein